jgi:hypothetical protein
MLVKIIAKIADLGSKKAGLSSDFWENCLILKKIFNWENAFYWGLLYKQENYCEVIFNKFFCIFRELLGICMQIKHLPM